MTRRVRRAHDEGMTPENHGRALADMADAIERLAGSAIPSVAILSSNTDQDEHAETLSRRMQGPRSEAVRLVRAVLAREVLTLPSSDPLRTDPDGDGPLTMQDPDDAIEVWTERELARLHAAWNTARTEDNKKLSQRIARACAWHAENIQPDNATCRPWALHAFFVVGVSSGESAIAMHADTMRNNAMYMLHASSNPSSQDPLRAADLYSVLILMDASLALRRVSGNERD